jgi:UDP-N-acetylenolpyruvoylglucosamine reductase
LEIKHFDIARFDYEYRKCHLSKESNITVFHAIMLALKNKNKTINISESDFIKPADPLEYYFG